MNHESQTQFEDDNVIEERIVTDPQEMLEDIENIISFQSSEAYSRMLENPYTWSQEYADGHKDGMALALLIINQY